MCRTLVLATQDFTKTFIVECDALGHGISSIIMQEGRPLAFEIYQIKGKHLKKTFMKNKCWKYYM